MMPSALLTGVDEERVQATQLLLSLNECAGYLDLARGSIDRIIIQHVKEYMIMTSLGDESIMNTMAKLDAKLGLILLDIEGASAALVRLIE